jgi:hypothetical protein
MRLNSVCLTFALLALFSSLSAGATDIKIKEEAVGAIEKLKAKMIKLSDPGLTTSAVFRVLSAEWILLANSPNKELMRFIRPNLKILRG